MMCTRKKLHLMFCVCSYEEGRPFPSIHCFHRVGLSSLFLLLGRLQILLGENNSKLIVLQLCPASEDSGWKAVTLSIYWFQLRKEKRVKLKWKLATYYLLCILLCIFWTVFLYGFVRYFEKLFPHVHEAAAYLLLCSEKGLCQVQTSLGSKLQSLVKFRIWLSWELWSQGRFDPTGNPFFQPVVKNATTENKAWYLTCLL